MSVQVDAPCTSTAGGFWLRGNLHTHTTRSDGDLTPQETITVYAELGHDFLALSDHNTPAQLAGLDPRGLILLPANEITGPRGHILALGEIGQLEAGPTQQATIDAVNARGGTAVLCHPNWGRDFAHYPWEILAGCTGYAGVEVYNGSIEEDPGSPCATDKWDRLLAAGRRVWALATDDVHRRPGHGRGWCAVRVRERTPEAVLQALRSGSFYASTGVTIETIELDGPLVRVASPDAEALAAYGELGRRLDWIEGREMVFDARRCPDPYFRIEVLGRAGRVAWTQPFSISSAEILRRQQLIEARPVMRVGRADRAPVLTGLMDDPAWSGAPETSAFLDAGTCTEPPVRTELRVLLAGGALHFGLRCAEPQIERLKLSSRTGGSANLWTDDGVEIFLDTENRAERYFHLMVNAAGYAYACQAGRIAAPGVRPVLQALAGRWADGYSLEVRVPLSELGLGAPPAPGTRWGFNAVRNRHPQAGLFAFSITGGGNHVPERFGWLEF